MSFKARVVAEFDTATFRTIVENTIQHLLNSEVILRGQPVRVKNFSRIDASSGAIESAIKPLPAFKDVAAYISSRQTMHYAAQLELQGKQASHCTAFMHAAADAGLRFDAAQLMRPGHRNAVVNAVLTKAVQNLSITKLDPHRHMICEIQREAQKADRIKPALVA